jgi:hypothetical protein
MRVWDRGWTTPGPDPRADALSGTELAKSPRIRFGDGNDSGARDVTTGVSLLVIAAALGSAAWLRARRVGGGGAA